MVIPTSSLIWIKSFKDVGISIRDLSRLQTGFGGFSQSWHKTPPSKKWRGGVRIDLFWLADYFLLKKRVEIQLIRFETGLGLAQFILNF